MKCLNKCGSELSVTRAMEFQEDMKEKWRTLARRGYQHLWPDWFLLPERALFSRGHPRPPPVVRLHGLRPLEEIAEPLHEVGSPFCVQQRHVNIK